MKKKEKKKRDRGGRTWRKTGGEAAELPADSSSVSVEANDTKTGVHCPQPRARGRGRAEREKEREKDYLARRVAERETKRISVSLVGRATRIPQLYVHYVLPRKEQQGWREVKGAARLI